MAIDLQATRKISTRTLKIYLPQVFVILEEMSKNIDGYHSKNVQNKAKKLLKEYNHLKQS